MRQSKKKKAMEEQKKLAILLVLWRIPAFSTSFVAACASRSLVLWLEFIENASILLPGILLLILSGRLNRNLKFRYNYGTEKVEAITALCCEMFDLAGLFCISLFAVRHLIKGSEKGEHLHFALAVSLLGLIIDIIIVLREKELINVHSSKLLHTAYISAGKELVFDVISIFTLVISILFSERSWIIHFSPVISIALVIPFSVLLLKHIKESLVELTDLTLDEENQLKILKILSEFFESYEELHDVRSRMTGEKIYIDIELSFHEDMLYSDIRSTVSAMKKRIVDELGSCTVNVILS